MESQIETMPGMEATENLIGTLVFFDETGFNKTTYDLRTGPLKALNSFKTLFNECLDFGNFTQERYEQLCEEGFRVIGTEFHELVEKEAAKTKSKILADNIRSHFHTNSPVAKLRNLWDAASSQIRQHHPATFKHFEVDEAGDIDIAYDELRKLYEVRIQSESQVEFYRACHALRETQQQVLKLLHTHSRLGAHQLQMSRLSYGFNVLTAQVNKQIVLNTELFSMFASTVWREKITE